MSKFNIIRAWKDKGSHRSSDEQTPASLPTVPGIVELIGEDLDNLVALGGNTLISDTCFLNASDTTFTNNNHM